MAPKVLSDCVFGERGGFPKKGCNAIFSKEFALNEEVDALFGILVEERAAFEDFLLLLALLFDGVDILDHRRLFLVLSKLFNSILLGAVFIQGSFDISDNLED